MKIIYFLETIAALGLNVGRGSNSGGGSSSDKQGKGSNDPIKMANKYGVLDDNDMEISH